MGLLGAMEGTVIALAGHTPDDAQLAVDAVAGVLGIGSDRPDISPPA